MVADDIDNTLARLLHDINIIASTYGWKETHCHLAGQTARTLRGADRRTTRRAGYPCPRLIPQPPDHTSPFHIIAREKRQMIGRLGGGLEITWPPATLHAVQPAFDNRDGVIPLLQEEPVDQLVDVEDGSPSAFAASGRQIGLLSPVIIQRPPSQICGAAHIPARITEAGPIGSDHHPIAWSERG
ncbi:hypothetical protein GRI97_06480 [Altererythrobacter xixiisoli]|uniref:Uncharacterized protein n=1 Tax=Croceibacterium xixiisoli TaxID=1476466 RepID=A0A6I4TWB1_9SPHN|nr:hypothetical protein [Croceibacterium xixiisoli]